MLHLRPLVFFQILNILILLPRLVPQLLYLLVEVLVLRRKIVHVVDVIDLLFLLLLYLFESHYLSVQLLIRPLQRHQLPLKIIYPINILDLGLRVDIALVDFFDFVAERVERLIHLLHILIHKPQLTLMLPPQIMQFLVLLRDGVVHVVELGFVLARNIHNFGALAQQMIQLLHLILMQTDSLFEIMNDGLIIPILPLKNIIGIHDLIKQHLQLLPFLLLALYFQYTLHFMVDIQQKPHIATILL